MASFNCVRTEAPSFCTLSSNSSDSGVLGDFGTKEAAQKSSDDAMTVNDEEADANDEEDCEEVDEMANMERWDLVGS